MVAIGAAHVQHGAGGAGPRAVAGGLRRRLSGLEESRVRGIGRGVEGQADGDGGDAGRAVAVHVRSPLHHHLKLLVDLVVFGFRPGRQRVLDIVRLRAVAAIAGAFVLLLVQRLHNVAVRPAFVRFVVLRVLEQDLVHVSARVLEQLVSAIEDDESDLTVAQHAQLVRLLHQTKLALRESDLNQGRGAGSTTASQDDFLQLT